LLDALQEGRLIELPDNNKTKALEYLATLIEAIPEMAVEGDITANVMAREQSHNTGIGQGWACPHARTRRDGELVCSVGWSPDGIDYGGPDNLPVHLVVMYFVPETQKNAYLKEISSLAKAIKNQPALQNLKALTDLAGVRHSLLDAISQAMEAAVPDARARMIKLEVKHAAAAQAPEMAVPGDLSRSIVPLSILSIPGAKPIVLCLDRDLVPALEGQEQLVSQLVEHGRSEHQGIQVLLRSSSNFQPDRVLYECLAFRSGGKNSSGGGG
jgi:mannitol/fructose-specific phosphotransferase system IIA component (Ntr-type)